MSKSLRIKSTSRSSRKSSITRTGWLYTHLAGFRRALTRTLKKYAEDSKMLEKVKVEISGDDFREGLTAVISVKVAEPQFEGQTKTKLGNNEVMGAVDQAVGEVLAYYLEEHPKEAKTIVDKAPPSPHYL